MAETGRICGISRSGSLVDDDFEGSLYSRLNPIRRC
jgi:hypothetical protein